MKSYGLTQAVMNFLNARDAKKDREKQEWIDQMAQKIAQADYEKKLETTRQMRESYLKPELVTDLQTGQPVMKSPDRINQAGQAIAGMTRPAQFAPYQAPVEQKPKTKAQVEGEIWEKLSQDPDFMEAYKRKLTHIPEKATPVPKVDKPRESAPMTEGQKATWRFTMPQAVKDSTSAFYGNDPDSILTDWGINKPDTGMVEPPISGPKRQIELPPDLAGDPEALSIIDDYNKGVLDYDTTVSLLSEKRMENK